MYATKALLLAVTCASVRLAVWAETDAVLLYDFAMRPAGSARDLSSGGHDGRISNAGWAGNSLYFNGRDTTVTAPSSPSLKVTSDLSVEAWVFVSELPDHEAYILAKDGCYTDGYGFALQTSGQVHFKLDGKNRWLRTTKALDLGEWSHLVGTFSIAQEQMALYLNAELQGTKSSADEIITSTKPFIIGNRHIRQHNEHFKGCIHRVRVLGRALTPEEVKRTFQSIAVALEKPSPPVVIRESVVRKRAAPRPGVESLAPVRSFVVENGRPYRLSVRVRGRFSKGSVGYRIVLLDAAKRRETGKRIESFPLTPSSSSEAWQTLSDSFYVNADTRAIGVHMLARGTDGQIEVGEASLVPTDEREITLPPRLSNVPADYGWQRFPNRPHPRLYFTEADWARLRRESKEGPKAKIWGTIRGEIEESFHDGAPDSYERPWAYPGYEVPKWRRMFNAIYGDASLRGLRYCETNAFAYRITGERRYLDNARRWMLRPCRWEHWCLYEKGKHVWSSYDLSVCHKLQGLATAYDWLYDDLPPDERKLVRDTLIKWSEVSFEHMRVGGWLHMGNHLGPQLAGQAIAAIALLGEHPAATQWLNQCIWQMKFHALRHPYLGRDGGLVEGYRFTSYIMNYLTSVAHAVKTLTGLQLIERRLIDWPLYGLIPPDHMVDLESSSYDRPYYYLRPYVMRLASELRDGHAQWWVESGTRAYGSGAASRGNLWSFIYLDPTVRAKPPSDIPASKHFRDIGWVYLRSGWGPRDLFFVLKSGPQDAKAFRNQNHFILSAFGERLVETPQVSRARKYPTEANSTFLVDGQGQRLGNTYSERVGDSPRLGRIGSCFLSPGFDFATGDAHQAYERDGKLLGKFERNVAFVNRRYFVMFDDLAGFDGQPSEFESLIRFAGSVEAESDATILSGARAKLLTRVLRPRYVRFRKQAVAGPQQLEFRRDLDADGKAEVARAGPSGDPCLVVTHTNRWGMLRVDIPFRNCPTVEQNQTLRLGWKARTSGRIRFSVELSSVSGQWQWHSPKIGSLGGWRDFDFSVPVPAGESLPSMIVWAFSGEGEDTLWLGDLRLRDGTGKDLLAADALGRPGSVQEAAANMGTAHTPFRFVPREKRPAETFLMVLFPLESDRAARPEVRLAKGDLPGAVVEHAGVRDVVTFGGQRLGTVEGLRTDARCAWVSQNAKGRTLSIAAVEAMQLIVGDDIWLRSSTPLSFHARAATRGMSCHLDVFEPATVQVRLPPRPGATWLGDSRVAATELSHDPSTGLTTLSLSAGAHVLRVEE